MIKTLTAAVFLFAVAIPSTASAQSRRTEAFTYRITEAPGFVDGPEGCMFSGTANITTRRGSPIGTSTLCVTSVDERVGPPYRFIERGTLTIDVADGHLALDVVFTDTYNADQSAAAHRARGTITSGTGRWADAAGTLQGHGIILFDSNGAPHPFLTYRVSFTLPS